ncbi:hypothetical protein COOONC_04288, partial [Cooperia oncophora]
LSFQLLHLLLGLTAAAFAGSYIPPGEDGDSCITRNLCSHGTVCVQTLTGPRCMAKDPDNNCDKKTCSAGKACEYSEPECNPDTVCYAEPKCKNQLSQITPVEQGTQMVANTFSATDMRINPPGFR